MNCHFARQPSLISTPVFTRLTVILLNGASFPFFTLATTLFGVRIPTLLKAHLGDDVRYVAFLKCFPTI